MKAFLTFIISLVLGQVVLAQLERKPVSEVQEVDLIFHAPRHMNLLTVESLDKKTLHFSIMHTFGTLDNGIGNLYGLDNGANIQFSFEYALSDNFSLGIGRQSRDKIYQLYGRYHLIRQTENNKRPFSLSLAGMVGVNSANYDFLPEGPPDFSQRASYGAQVMLARKFTDRLSIQVSPMLAYFNDPLPVYQIEGEENFYLALGLSGKYKISPRSSITLQWIPNLNNDLENNLGIGIDIEAGGHVFQMYFVTSQMLYEPYLLAGGNGTPGEEFRVGFNVNRVFATGQKNRKK